jgi:chemotaxis protein MotB
MKRRRIKSAKKNSGAPKWMVTYSDMVTLILVFFILLFSMSQIDRVKFEAIAESFDNRVILDFLPSAVPMEHPSESAEIIEGEDRNELLHFMEPDERMPGGMEEPDGDTQGSLDSLLTEVENYLDENKLNNVITANRTERGVVLVLQESILFDSGEAAVLDSGKNFLKEVGKLLFDIPNRVKVEGHTDSRPIASHLYPSNWELSGARAGSVTRYLINEFQLEETRFTIVGYSDTRPLAENTNAVNMSKNRRVEIVILEANSDLEEPAL